MKHAILQVPEFRYRKLLRIPAFFSLLFFIHFQGKAQDFIQNIYVPDTPFTINQTALVISTSGLDFITIHGINDRNLILTRFDEKSNIVWKRRLVFGGKITPSLMKRNEVNEILVSGFYHIGTDKLLFFLKINEAGKILDFSHFSAGQEVFETLYDIDLNSSGNFIVYGLLSKKVIGSPTTDRAVTFFDKNLTKHWCKRLEGMGNDGKAKLMEDNSMFITSSYRIAKLGPDGTLNWAWHYSNLPLIVNPIVKDSIIYVAGNDNNLSLSILAKLDTSGKILGVSRQVDNYHIRKIIQFDSNKIAIGGVAKKNNKYTGVISIFDNNLNFIRQLIFDNYFQPTNDFADFSYDMDKSAEKNLVFTSAVSNQGMFTARAKTNSFGKCVTSHSNSNDPPQLYRNNTDITMSDFGFSEVWDTSGYPYVDSVQWDFFNNCCITFNKRLRSDTLLCPGDTLKFGLHYAADFEWNTGDTTDSITIKAPGAYILKLTSGCDTLIDTVNVAYAPEPVPSFTASTYSAALDEEIIFEDLTTGNYDVEWRTGDDFDTTGKIIVHAYRENGNYTVRHILTDQLHGCRFESKFNIKVKTQLVHFPNAFTPNDDRWNPVFKPLGLGIAEYDMLILNRWGQIVFHEKNMGWDGYNRANLISPEGLYKYHVRVLFSDGTYKIFRGEIYLLK